jgi:hypothetical protein
LVDVQALLVGIERIAIYGEVFDSALPWFSGPEMGPLITVCCPPPNLSDPNDHTP